MGRKMAGTRFITLILVRPSIFSDSAMISKEPTQVISAMVLPGISGSTLLLIFGLYVPIMGAVRATMGLDLSYLPILMVFAAGIACGMLLFVRLIRMCLERFRSQTIYAIIGMMLGSLFSITQGPLTLSEPQPAMSLDTFSIVFFLIGGAVVGGLQLLRSRLEEPAEG